MNKLERKLERKLASKFAIRLSMLTICATALMLVPSVTPVEAKAQKTGTVRTHRHLARHHRQWRPQMGDGWQAQPAPRSYSGEVCPGIARSFDCKIWPPPFEDDPDRKASKF